MRIGIYTQPLWYNYGGLLQAWALQTVLKRMGHYVVTFNPNLYMHLSWKKKCFVYLKRLYRIITGKPGITSLRWEEKYNHEHDLKMQNLKPFIDNNINVKEYNDVKELSPLDYDVLIAGSDQVWRPKYNHTFGRTIENAFFEFAKDWNVKRIAYAASFGADEWEFTKEQTIRCAQLAKKFQAISVREMSGISLCNKHLGVDATLVLDPTLLLTRDDYELLLSKGKSTTKPIGDMLCYILDESDDKSKLIKQIAEERKMTPFRAQSKIYNQMAKIEEKIQPSVEQWIRNFIDSKFVITDSFHACVFSILFNKPFLVIGNNERGMARYKSLFSLLYLDNHLLISINDYDKNDPYDIKDETYQALKSIRDDSFSFIEKVLGI